jgi:Subtilase family
LGVVSDPSPEQAAFIYQPSPDVLREYGPFLRGVMDLRAGLATTEPARRVLELMRSAHDAESLDRLEGHLDEIGEWAHGTHVAGILLAGLPQARLSIFRSAWAGEARIYHHRGPTDPELAAESENAEQVAAFIREHGIRVVNVSLGFARDYLEDELRHEPTYTREEDIQRRASLVQELRRQLWAQVFASCPDTLFVVAAGNSNRDVLEYGDVPASLPAANSLVVGAVDRRGEWAPFTNSNSTRVRVFDFGVEVDSVVPGGEHGHIDGLAQRRELGGEARRCGAGVATGRGHRDHCSDRRPDGRSLRGRHRKRDASPCSSKACARSIGPSRCNASMRIEFQQTDAEFANAWWGEYLRTPTTIARLLLSPLLMILGARHGRGGHDAVSTLVGYGAVLLGGWWILKPFMLVRTHVYERRKAGASKRTMVIELREEGLTISDGKKSQRVPWERVRRAGARRDYVWFELSSGLRGTIPNRAIVDRDELQKLFVLHEKWA